MDLCCTGLCLIAFVVSLTVVFVGKLQYNVGICMCSIPYGTDGFSRRTKAVIYRVKCSVL